MSYPVWQYRKYYGPKPDGTEWSPWTEVTEGTVCYGPRTLLDQNPDVSGRIEFRKTSSGDPHCEYLGCELAVEDLGLCFEHLNAELDAQDPWPDFDDELPGMWSQSDLIGGETDRDWPAMEADELDNYTGYGA
jgi:hypothetical protein